MTYTITQQHEGTTTGTITATTDDERNAAIWNAQRNAHAAGFAVRFSNITPNGVTIDAYADELTA